MTSEQAYNRINNFLETWRVPQEEAEYIDGALKVAMGALKKQISMKPKDGWYGENSDCPCCGHVVSGKYCRECGQALSWEE